MKKFDEWLTKTCGLDDSNDNLITNEDDALVVNQLEQFVDRIIGILYNVTEEKRGELVEKVISDLRGKL